MKRTNAFILKTIPFKEADRLVTLFSEDFGRISGIACGSLKMKSKITGALEPLTQVECRFVAPHGRELVVITGCDPISSLFGRIDSPAFASVIAVLTELTHEFNHEHDPNADFYRLLVACHQALKQGKNPELVLRYFELFTIRFAGYLPEVQSIKNPELQSCIRKLSRTHILECEELDDRLTGMLGRYFRRIIRHALERPLRTYSVYARLMSSARQSTVKRQ